MMKYGFGTKLSTAMGILFLLLGLTIGFLTGHGGNAWVFYIMVAMWPIQLMYSLGVSGLVASSPWKKALETWVPTAISFLGLLACYLLMLVFTLPGVETSDAKGRATIASELIFSGVMAMILMLYCGTAYKHFVLSTVLFFIMIYGMFFVMEIIGSGFAEGISISAATVIGLLEIVVGAFLQYGVSLLLYRYPLAKRAQLRALQKYMP